MKSKISRKGKNVTGEGGTFLPKKEKKKDREPSRTGRPRADDQLLHDLLQAPLSTGINFHDI